MQGPLPCVGILYTLLEYIYLLYLAADVCSDPVLLNVKRPILQSLHKSAGFHPRSWFAEEDRVNHAAAQVLCV